MAEKIQPEDRKLDRVKFHPESNRAYAFADVRKAPSLVARYWPGGANLDQGHEGACVAFANANDLNNSPVRIKNISDSTALGFYQDIRAQDRAMGNNWDSGASTVAGMHVMRDKGYITEFRWGFTMEEIRDALITEGPVILGIEWLDGMYYTEPNGRVKVTGNVVGGHEIMLNGWSPRRKLKGETVECEYYRWRNSWGPDYGINGNGYIRAEDLADLIITRRGEAAIPMGRKLITL